MDKVSGEGSGARRPPSSLSILEPLSRLGKMYSAEIYSTTAHHQSRYCEIVVPALSGLFEPLEEISIW